MGSLFSSPSKQATSAAQATGAISQQEISDYENYVTGQQGQLRSAIGGLGENPYFAAGAQMDPSAYKVDPANTVSFGQSNTPKGLTQGAPTATPSNPFAPPPGTGVPRSTQPVGTKTGGETTPTTGTTPPPTTTQPGVGGGQRVVNPTQPQNPFAPPRGGVMPPNRVVF